MPPSRIVRRLVVRSCVSAVALLLTGLAAGCATTEVPQRPAATAMAKVVVRNSTPHRWRVTFREARGSDTIVIHVAPRAVDEVSFPRSGEFWIEQAIETSAADRPQPRTFSTRLVVGERYQWTLATLLTASGTERIGL